MLSNGPVNNSAVLVLEPDLAAVARARDFAHDHYGQVRECTDVCDTLALLVSELVTNAFVHGRSRTRVQIRVLPTMVRVDVSDENPVLPVLQAADRDALSGRGLAMVQLLASAWGVQTEPIGKTVWAKTVWVELLTG